ncbi:radical SAM protein [Streptomyces sp. 147326]|uniref:radical SAM protein n=1 Tax=Streptomyces sp. 147326 TaxID=3074379 RepID=UPI0038577ABC
MPFVSELHHEAVGDRHAWVGVKEAALAVLDEAQHEIMCRLVEGEAPGHVAASVGWEAVSGTISVVSASGLVSGLTGYRDRTRLGVTRFARLHLTRSCQLECVHCYADSSPRVDRSNELPTSRWMRFVRDFAAQGGERVLFTGGEALLHDGCLELMGNARDLGLHVTLFSNGIQVPRLADEIHAKVDQVQISLDGPDAGSNDVVRGKNTFNHVIRALDALAERGTETRVGMTIVPSAWAEWVEKFDRIRERYAGAPSVSFRLSYGVMAYGRGVEVDNTEIAPKHEVDAFLNAVNGDSPPQITRHTSGCGYGEQIVVAPDGSVHPCHLLDGAVCHLDDMALTDITRLLAGLARQVDVDHVEGCRTCEIRYLCGGSCRVLAGRATGSRLLTTCTPDKKRDKYRNLVASFGTAHGAGEGGLT